MSILNEDLSTCEPWTKDLCFEVYVSTYLVLEGVFVHMHMYVHVRVCRYTFVYMRDTHVEARKQAEVLLLRQHPCVVWRHGSSLVWQSPNTVDWVFGEL